jgi:hypothetical protein
MSGWQKAVDHEVGEAFDDVRERFDDSRVCDLCSVRTIDMFDHGCAVIA